MAAPTLYPKAAACSGTAVEATQARAQLAASRSHHHRPRLSPMAAITPCKSPLATCRSAWRTGGSPLRFARFLADSSSAPSMCSSVFPRSSDPSSSLPLPSCERIAYAFCASAEPHGDLHRGKVGGSRPIAGFSKPLLRRVAEVRVAGKTRSSRSAAARVAGDLGSSSRPVAAKSTANGGSSRSLAPKAAAGNGGSSSSSRSVAANVASTTDGNMATPMGDDAAGVISTNGRAEKLLATVQLGALFGLWYLFNIYFNIYNKQVLKVFPHPMTLTAVQFGVGAALVQIMWLLGLHPRPSITKKQLLAILPLAMVHTLGNTFTNLSLGKVAVSFTHTIKALEPFFSVLLSALVLGEQPTALVVVSLLPIVAGVALASATEASFNWAGFLTAMASNITFQSRNVLSKKLMLKKEASLDNINLFSIITTMSFLLLLPVVLMTEGVRFTPQILQAQGLDVQQVVTRTLIAAVCFHSYQQVSYMILQRVSPVTHSVGNCVKRVIVIVTSVLFFRTPVSAINAIGTGIALAGVFAYTRAKSVKQNKL